MQELTTNRSTLSTGKDDVTNGSSHSQSDALSKKDAQIEIDNKSHTEYNCETQVQSIVVKDNSPTTEQQLITNSKNISL